MAAPPPAPSPSPMPGSSASCAAAERPPRRQAPRPPRLSRAGPAAPRLSALGSRAADQLQWDQERLVGRAGPLLQRDLAGAVAAQVGVVLRPCQLRRLLGGRGLGQLGVEQ